MTVLLHCSRCGGNIRPYKHCGYRICDVDGTKLTAVYRGVIIENGCSFFTLRSIPRKETPLGYHPDDVIDSAVQRTVQVPKSVINLDTKRDPGKLPYPDEYEGNVIEGSENE
jgi:hypothetical protein